MRKLLLSLSFLLFSLISFQQVTTVLVAPPYPNPQISEWENGNGDPWSLTVNNFTGVDIDVKITGTIELNGDLVAVIDVAKVATQTLNPGVTTFTNPDLVPADAITFSSLNTADILLSGKLPAGLYTYCAELVHPLDQTSIIARSCVTFVISEQQLPILLTPLNGQVVMPEMANSQIFTWTPMTPPAIAPQTLKYRFVMMEIMEGQTDVQALQGNTAIIDEELDGAQTTMPWPPSLVADTGKYVWTIQSIDPANLDNQNNPTPYGLASTQGYSAPHTLTIGDTSGNTSPDLLDELTGDTLYAGFEGEFKVVLDSNVTASAGTFTGGGKVFIPMLRAWFEVKFTNIKVATGMRLHEGNVYVPKYTSAPEYPIDWAFQVGSTMPWTHNVVEAIDGFVQNNAPKLPFGVGDNLDSAMLADAYADASDNLLKVPQGINGADISSVEDINLAFTEIAFKPNESQINAIVSMGVPASWEVLDGTNALGFKAKNFLFHPRNFEFTRGRIELVEDLQINIPGDKYAIIFKKPVENDTVRYGTFYEWDTKDDSSFFSVDIDVEFSRELMLPVPDNGSAKVKAAFNGTSANWNDFLFYGNLPRSEIASTNGLEIEALAMGVDFSETRNVGDITFPDLYNGETTELFKGFSLKQGTLYLPEEIKTHSEGQINFSLSDVIIDKTGFTFDLSANNVLSYPNVDMAKLVASLDTVKISMVQNTVAYGMLTGKITIPVSKAEESNALVYKGVFNNGGAFSDSTQSYFNFNISPLYDIKAEVWKADLTIDNTSELGIDIGVGSDKGKYGFYLDLDGEISIVTDLGKIKDVELAGVEFQDLGISYYKLSGSSGNNNSNSNSNSNTGKNGGTPPPTTPPPSGIWAGKTNGFNFSPGSWAFASPQKKVAGFEFSIGNNGGGVSVGIDLQSRTKEDGELYRGELLLTGVLNLTENIGGGLTMGIVFAFRGDDNASSDEEGGSGGGSNGNGGGISLPGGVKGSKASAPSSGMSDYYYDVTHQEDVDFIHDNIDGYPLTPPVGIGDYFRPRFIKARLDCVFIDVETQAVKILGYVKFRENDPIYGDGFKGKVKAEFSAAAIDFQIDAEAEFGKTKYQALTADSAYRYWRVEAGVGFSPGVPLGPLPLTLNGGGLGAYKNMTTDAAGNSSESEDQASALNGAIQTPPAGTSSLTSGLNFKPKEGNWGFMGKLRMALTAEATFNFDAGIRAEFGNNGSLQQIVFRGDFWAGAAIAKRPKALVNGFVQVGYDAPHRLFALNVGVNINKSPVSGYIPFDLMIDGVGPADPVGAQSKWSIRLGTPDNPASVTVNLTGEDEHDSGDSGTGASASGSTPQGSTQVNAGAYFYMMCGNDIPPAGGFSPGFINDYNAALSQSGGNNSDEGTSLYQMQADVGNNGASNSQENEIINGAGFAFGIGLKLGKPEPTYKKLFGPVSFWYRFGAGAELNLALMDRSEYTCANTDHDPIGMEGWRVKGSFGFWAVAGAGLHVKKYNILWVEKCGPDQGKPNGCNYTLADLGIGAWIYGEFPKPTFAAGAVDGRIKILVFNVKFNAEFKFGEKCDEQYNGGAPQQVDSDYFTNINWLQQVGWRGGNPNSLKFTMDSRVSDDRQYEWMKEDGTSEIIIVRSVPFITSHNFKHDGTENKFKRKKGCCSSRWLNNSQLTFKTNYGSDWQKVKLYRDGNTKTEKRGNGNRVYVGMRGTLYKYVGNGNWTPLLDKGQQMHKNYSGVNTSDGFIPFK